MTIPFAIRGAGRIGRALVRIAADRPRLDLRAIADIAPVESVAHLLAHDSVHGESRLDVAADSGALRLGSRRVAYLCEPEAARIDWQSTGARIVVEASGLATTRALAAEHLASARSTPGDGPSKVLIGAIAFDADWMTGPGVDMERYDPERHHVVSHASCTTHCLALLVDVLHREYGLRRAMMNEVHSYTANQRLVDGHHHDLRRARAAAVNIVPTSTAAPAATEILIPELAGRLDGIAVRVPTPNVALMDLVAQLEQPAEPAAINDAFRRAAEGRLAGLLSTEARPLVSSDFVGNAHSAIVDLEFTRRIGGDMVRVLAWYDNEWGYAHRLADILTAIGERL